MMKLLSINTESYDKAMIKLQIILNYNYLTLIMIKDETTINRVKYSTITFF